jgi:hypothetical protein
MIVDNALHNAMKLSERKWKEEAVVRKCGEDFKSSLFLFLCVERKRVSLFQ